MSNPQSSRMSSQFSRHTQPAADSAAGHEAEDQKSLRARQKAERLTAEGKYDQAIHVLNGAQQSPDVRNLKGVCLLRTGAIDQAVQLYRGYLLHAGSTRSRVVLGETHVINFATALLMSGRPAGCLDVLSELPESTHPAIARLRDTIRNWARGLGWWSRLNWWLGKLEPDPCVVTLSFLPGEITSSIPIGTPTHSANGSVPNTTHAAV